jgi:hypothetical protein
MKVVVVTSFWVYHGHLQVAEKVPEIFHRALKYMKKHGDYDQRQL